MPHPRARDIGESSSFSICTSAAAAQRTRPVAAAQKCNGLRACHSQNAHPLVMADDQHLS